MEIGLKILLSVVSKISFAKLGMQILIPARKLKIIAFLKINLNLKIILTFSIIGIYLLFVALG